jgi:hypothetical protein
MTDQEQNIIVAEACGWKDCKVKPDVPYHVVIGIPPVGSILAITYKRHPIPDYGQDLNAMHEAENVLFKKCLRSEYEVELCNVCRPEEATPDSIDDLLNAAVAIASQRREAFIRTIGKWKE